MIARGLLVTFAFVLASCGQTSAPPRGSDPPSPGDEAPLSADLLANEPLAGAWESVGDGATTGVRFSPTSYPNTLTIGCNNGTGRVFLNWTVSDPVQNAELSVYTTFETVRFAATGTNDGANTLGVDVDGADPRLSVLKTQQARFAVQGLGQSIVVPWDTSIVAALNECAG